MSPPPHFPEVFTSPQKFSIFWPQCQRTWELRWVTFLFNTATAMGLRGPLFCFLCHTSSGDYEASLAAQAKKHQVATWVRRPPAAMKAKCPHIVQPTYKVSTRILNLTHENFSEPFPPLSFLFHKDHFCLSISNRNVAVSHRRCIQHNTIHTILLFQNKHYIFKAHG